MDEVRGRHLELFGEVNTSDPRRSCRAQLGMTDIVDAKGG
jgi:hypothetical protein